MESRARNIIHSEKGKLKNPKAVVKTSQLLLSVPHFLLFEVPLFVSLRAGLPDSSFPGILYPHRTSASLYLDNTLLINAASNPRWNEDHKVLGHQK